MKYEKRYTVISPEMWGIEPVLDDGTGPKEYFKCYVEVDAVNKHEARIRAIKTEEMKPWVDLQRAYGKLPMTGLVVEEIE